MYTSCAIYMAPILLGPVRKGIGRATLSQYYEPVSLAAVCVRAVILLMVLLLCCVLMILSIGKDIVCGVPVVL